jgi:hypothetical protein
MKSAVDVLCRIVPISLSFALASLAHAAPCEPSKLDAAKLAQVYQGGAQRLAELYTISRTSAEPQDVEIALQAQGPLSSFSDATYLMVDLLKLRSTLVNEHDRSLLDADVRANLELASEAFTSAESYLAALAPRTQNLSLQKAIEAARQQVADGVVLYGACIKQASAAPAAR